MMTTLFDHIWMETQVIIDILLKEQGHLSLCYMNFSIESHNNHIGNLQFHVHMNSFCIPKKGTSEDVKM